MMMTKIGATIHGVLYLGTIDKLGHLRIPFDEIIIVFHQLQAMK